MTLGELLAELKRRHRLTDTEVAATLGISERTYTDGQRAEPESLHPRRQKHSLK